MLLNCAVSKLKAEINIRHISIPPTDIMDMHLYDVACDVQTGAVGITLGVSSVIPAMYPEV